MAVYKAPKPQYTNWQWTTFFALRVLFPPLLLWDASKWGFNMLFGGLVSNLVMPGLNKFFHDVDAEQISTIKGLSVHQHTVITHDKAELDTIELKHQSQDEMSPEYQKYIINLVGNAASYSYILDEMAEDAKALKANVVGFDFRGVHNSKKRPTSKDDLVTDGIAQVQRLLDSGVSPENITLKAHSIGAGVGSLVAAHFHQLGKPINIFNGRSFSNFTNFVVGHIRLARNEQGLALGQKETLLGKILGYMALPFVKLALMLTNWEIHAGRAFRSIPESHREHIVVRSEKSIRSNRLDDAIIPHYASIHESLADDRQAKKANIQRQIDSTDPTDYEKIKQLQTQKENVGKQRKMHTTWPLVDGHNTGLKSLYNHQGVNGVHFFRQFVDEASNDHGVKASTQQTIRV